VRCRPYRWVSESEFRQRAALHYRWQRPHHLFGYVARPSGLLRSCTFASVLVFLGARFLNFLLLLEPFLGAAFLAFLLLLTPFLGAAFCASSLSLALFKAPRVPLGGGAMSMSSSFAVFEAAQVPLDGGPLSMSSFVTEPEPALESENFTILPIDFWGLRWGVS
jgi:hypothetical protein